MILDTHLHVIDRTRLRYPWLAETPLNRDWRYRTYETEARRAGIVAALHMEVDVLEEDIDGETAFAAQLAATDDSLVIGAISSARPEAPDFAASLERLSANPFIKGLRRVLHVAPDALSQTEIFRENLRRIGRAGLPFDLCVLARQLPLARALVDAAPDTTFILDHCGVPDIKSGALDPWRADIAALAERPNVYAKISGVVAYGDADRWTLNDLRPWVEHTIECFGWDRVVWGGDWPVCTLGGGLSTWIAASQMLVAGASLGEREKLFDANARRLWRLDAAKTP